TTADVNAIAQQLTYSNTNDLPPASVQINWDLSDGNGTAQGTGGALGASGSMTVNITSVNESPTLTGVDATPTFIEDQSAIVLDSTVTIADVELDALNSGAGDYTGASLTLARNLAANPDDVFGFTAGSGISLSGGNLVKGGDIIASFDTSVAGELTITFTSPATAVATTADVNAIAQQLNYNNTNDLPPASVQINWDLSDGNGTAQGTGGALSASGSMTVSITSVNENPTLTGVDATPTYVEDQPAIVLDSTVTIADVELDALNGGAGDYTGASLTLARNLAANPDDVFGFTTGSGISLSGGNLLKGGDIIASFDTSVAGELTITFTSPATAVATTADVNAIAQQLNYSNTNDLPPASVQINWDLNDGNGTAQGTGGALGASGSMTVSITSVNENPTLTGVDATPTYIEDQAAVVLDSTVTITDAELDALNGGAGDYTGASLTLARNLAANPDDVFGFTAGSGISLSGGNLLKGGDIIASFDTSVAGELTITFVSPTSAVATTADVNAIAQQLTYSNTNDLPPASVQINWDLSDGNGTAQGTGGALSASGSMTVSITSVNENPTLTGVDATPTYTEDQAAIVLDSTVTITDVELDALNGGAGDYTGASLTLARNLAANPDDVFGFTTGSGISLSGGNLLKGGDIIASFDTSVAGELTITFTSPATAVATTADVNAIAQQLNYSNTSDLPPASVQINWDLNDGNGTAQGTGGALGASGSMTVNITSVNENPTLTGVDATPTFIEDQSAIVLDSTVTIADVELDALNGGAGDYTGASLTLARNLAANPDDVFGFTAGNGISLSGGNLVKGGDIIASFDTSVAGELTITFTSPATAVATTADVNAIAQQLTYSNTNDLPPASVQINWDLSDGNGTAQGTGGALSASGSMTVSITSVNENPTLTGVDATPTYTEDQAAIVLDSTVTITDVELDALNGGAGDYTGASLTLARNLAANPDDVFGFTTGSGISLSGGNLVKGGDIIASFDTSVAGELTITFTSPASAVATTADVNAIAQQLTYSNTNDLPPASVQINWDLSDGNGTAQGTGGAL
ncbi:beta strand repeat-containing protein, partial [Candidatus Litorirhabdus singularis]|uniref:beta strand repeat-containing protein n=1 Tax=Candidatus Litorirhabdus singularis TaxID=2518993 RepID=UPI00243088E6